MDNAFKKQIGLKFGASIFDTILSRTNSKLLMILTSICMVACGSVPNKQLEAFGENASKVMSISSATINEMNESSIEATLRAKNAEVIKDKSKASTINKVFLDSVQPTLDLGSKNRLPIVIAIKSLKNYAASISALAKTDDGKSLNEAIVKVNTSLVDLNSAYSSFTTKQLFKNDDLGEIAAAVSAIGKKYTDEKRKKALTKLITEADPKIKMLVDEIKFAIDSADVAGTLEANRNYMQLLLIKEYQAKLKKGDFDADINGAYTTLKQIWDLNRASSMVNKEVDALKNTLDQLAKSHNIIAEELYSYDFDTAAVVNAIGDLNSTYKTFKDLKSNLTTCDKVTVQDNGQIVCATN